MTTAKPALLTVHDQPRQLDLIQQELRGRYAADYELIGYAAPAAALQDLAGLPP
jgi:hypothetical protein